MRLREVDVRFADGVDRRQVVTLGDALTEVLADLGTVELVSLSVAGPELATFAFATTTVAEIGHRGAVALPTPGVGPAEPVGTPAPADAPAPDATDCREAVLAAAAGLGLGPVEVVADRVATIGAPSPDETAVAPEAAAG